MAKKSSKSSKPIKQKSIKTVEEKIPVSMPNLPPELEKKLKSLKDKLDTFKKKVLDKFGDYIVGISLLPPEKQLKEADKSGLKERPKEGSEEAVKEAEKADENKIHVLVIVDDTTSQKMTKDELHNKFSSIIKKIAEETDKNILPQSVLMTDVWQNSYDGKYDLNKMISLGAPIHDTGILAAVKITEVHKSMVIQKFEKYILSYVLMGSITRGQATPTSDIDVWIIIDDTDVKKMSRAELKDKLRAIIAGMAIEAGEITGIKNKLSCQVHILTDVWDSLKEANPVVFTFLRDGVPFYDRGIFMPWKQLLRMGRIKPSREAIDLFMSTGDQSLKRVKLKLKDMGMEDTFYAILTPSQAAIMLYGLPPPTPHETPDVLEEIFVKKEKMLEKEYVEILRKNVEVRKSIEHGSKKELTGTELDQLINDAEKFLERIKELFKSIEEMHNQKSVLFLYDEIMTIIRDVLKMEGIEKAQDEQLTQLFEDELISTGKVPARYLRDLNEIIEVKHKYDNNKLTKNDVEKARKGSSGLIRFLVEYMQRKRGRELERTKIRVKHGEKFGEVILMDKVAFIIHDIDDKEEQRIEKAAIKENGGLGPAQKSSLEELEKELVKMKFPAKVFIKQPLFEDLKSVFGRDVEVLMHY
ncbi:MAG: nucleotidyltransferase domain-containing protein [Nanoarchaeota archaeon]|nr:nucleotidyltransferase domain-containing protein [Nanoarchaeota archaeon]MBU1644587.1 nucleotidyltransferase domain-containing protein [Nanoarchaeota archaeon]MBU1976977.1 nucleotidyltransferase domain-containing protein [Nanoarchaeota archaeon]